MNTPPRPTPITPAPSSDSTDRIQSAVDNAIDEILSRYFTQFPVVRAWLYSHIHTALTLKEDESPTPSKLLSIRLKDKQSKYHEWQVSVPEEMKKKWKEALYFSCLYEAVKKAHISAKEAVLNKERLWKNGLGRLGIQIESGKVAIVPEKCAYASEEWFVQNILPLKGRPAYHLFSFCTQIIAILEKIKQQQLNREAEESQKLSRLRNTNTLKEIHDQITTIDRVISDIQSARSEAEFVPKFQKREQDLAQLLADLTEPKDLNYAPNGNQQTQIWIASRKENPLLLDAKSLLINMKDVDAAAEIRYLQIDNLTVRVPVSPEPVVVAQQVNPESQTTPVNRRKKIIAATIFSILTLSGVGLAVWKIKKEKTSASANTESKEIVAKPLLLKEIAAWEKLRDIHEKTIADLAQDFSAVPSGDAGLPFVKRLSESVGDQYMKKMFAGLKRNSMDVSQIQRTLWTRLNKEGSSAPGEVLFLARDQQNQPVPCVWDFSSKQLKRGSVPSSDLPVIDSQEIKKAKETFSSIVMARIRLALSGVTPDNIYPALCTVAQQCDKENITYSQFFEPTQVTILQNGGALFSIKFKINHQGLRVQVPDCVPEGKIKDAMQSIIISGLEKSYGIREQEGFTASVKKEFSKASLTVTEEKVEDGILHLTLITIDGVGLTAQIPVPRTKN